MLAYLKIPAILTIVALAGTALLLGPAATLTVGILAILEIAFSFDNAIVNSKILERMSKIWQQRFLTIGIVIAVFGMRLVFPIIIVALAAHLSPWATFEMAITNPNQYARHLYEAHPAIAAFGGAFLGMLFLDWLFDEREVRWLGPVEAGLAKLGQVQNMAISIMLGVLFVATTFFDHSVTIATAGILGMVTYILVNSIDAGEIDMKRAVASGGIGTFLYLEVVDASFSFDGVIGAFAITKNVILIAIGLGIGALYVRGMTVGLVRKGTLSEYIYLEHGAHWAIGILAALLFTTIQYDIPEVVTGLLGVGFIVAAFLSSLRYNKRKVRSQNVWIRKK